VLRCLHDLLSDNQNNTDYFADIVGAIPAVISQAEEWFLSKNIYKQRIPLYFTAIREFV
jgi:hypothetical protein